MPYKDPEKEVHAGVGVMNALPPSDCPRHVSEVRERRGPRPIGPCVVVSQDVV